MPGNSDRPLSATVGEAMIPMQSMVCTADGGAGAPIAVCGLARTSRSARIRTTTYSVPASGNAGLLHSAARTLTPFEGLRIVSVRLRSVNLHDFDDPQDNGEYDLKGLCEAVASCISSMSSHPKETTPDFFDH